MHFIPGRKPGQDRPLPPLWFIIDRGYALVRNSNGSPSFLDSEDLRPLGLDGSPGVYFGATERHACFLKHGDASSPVPAGFEWVELRTLFGTLGEEHFWIAGRARHLAEWDRTHRHCGSCGAAMMLKEDEWAKACPTCGQIYFPQISPVVIVSVVDGDRILLTRNSHYRNYPYFTLMAGFVEAGEDLESAVHREIQEEVGVTVKNLRYFGSQPWPFPNSLMIGFTAEYAGGEVTPDPSEILEARWFERQNLPEIPRSKGIARKMIDAFATG